MQVTVKRRKLVSERCLREGKAGNGAAPSGRKNMIVLSAHEGRGFGCYLRNGNGVTGEPGKWAVGTETANGYMSSANVLLIQKLNLQKAF